jgi:peptidoglycan hydrolase CwlO-like protein
MQKFFTTLLATLFLVVLSVRPVLAQNCDQQYQCQSGSDDYRSCLNNLKDCWQTQVDKARSEANTLQSAINIINGQIRIQSLRISQTVAEIEQLEREITELSERIEGLSISLNRLSEALIKRVRESYKQIRLPYKNNVLAADSFNQFLSQQRYISIASDQTLDLMKKTELQRLVYNEQKDLKETKQAEVEQLRKELQSQKNVLDGQKASKDSLLKETKNNESTYQNKVEQLEAQLASFGRFAATVGNSLLNGQTKCDSWGCYYSQRDAQWGAMYLGRSQWTLATSGCLVTSVAMVATHYGKSLTPAQIASNDFFSGGDLSKTISIPGVANVSRVAASCGTSTSCLDSSLEGGKPVIVKIRQPGSTSGDHFIVILEKKDGSYIMHDPVIENGGYRKFTDHYSLSSITRIDKVSVY